MEGIWAHKVCTIVTIGATNFALRAFDAEAVCTEDMIHVPNHPGLISTGSTLPKFCSFDEQSLRNQREQRDKNAFLARRQQGTQHHSTRIFALSTTFKLVIHPLLPADPLDSSVGFACIVRWIRSAATTR